MQDDLEARQQQVIFRAYYAMATAVQLSRRSHSLSMQSAELARELLKLLDRPPRFDDVIDGNPRDRHDTNA